MDSSLTSRIIQVLRNRPLLIFKTFWAILFFLYLPAAHSGWVSDTHEWLYKIRNNSFADYMNTAQSRGSLYQFTQIVTYLFYRVFGDHAWPWHLLFITLQAANASLLVIIFDKLFTASAVQKSFIIAAGGALLFCICPHISEVVVWKASFHYLLSMLMMLGILYLLQCYLNEPKYLYTVCSTGIFFVSSFSLECFYLIPIFAAMIIIYYRYILGYDSKHCKKAALQFILPFLSIILFHQLLMHFISAAPGIDAETGQSLSGYLRKPPLLLFQTIFFSRYLDHSIWEAVYSFFSSARGLSIFYGIILLVLSGIALRYRNIKPAYKSAILVFCFMMLCLAFVSPMWLPDAMVILFSRYTYFMLPFMYMLLMFLLVRLPERMRVATFVIYAFINIQFTIQTNAYWKDSARITKQLIQSFPIPEKGKTALILNLPEYMNGAPMFGPWLHFTFRQTYNLYHTEHLTDSMHDVLSYNMAGAGDGAHVLVINDTLLHVTLNQWGTWWWANLTGAYSYENKDYKLNLIDPGHWYELILKKPVSAYQLYFQVGDQWKIVDMNRRDDQY